MKSTQFRLPEFLACDGIASDLLDAPCPDASRWADARRALDGGGTTVYVRPSVAGETYAPIGSGLLRPLALGERIVRVTVAPLAGSVPRLREFFAPPEGSTPEDIDAIVERLSRVSPEEHARQAEAALRSGTMVLATQSPLDRPCALRLGETDATGVEGASE